MQTERRWFTGLALAVCLSNPAAAADDAKSWEGQTVIITTRSGVRLTNMKGAEEVVLYPTMLVRRAEGDRLFVQHDFAAGWINRDQAVLLADAEEAFSKRLKFDPRDADSYFRRATARLVREDLDGAQKDIDEAIRLDPQVLYFIGRGAVWQKRREYERAAAEYTEAIRLDPKSADSLYWRGNIRVYQSKFDDAIADFSKAIELDPEQLHPHWKLALAWERKGDPERAIALFGAAIEKFPKVPSLHVERGRLLLAKKDYERAVADFDTVIAQMPSYAWAHSGRGIALLHQKKYASAIAAWDEAIRLDPKDWISLNNRAWVRATCPDEALRDGKRALDEATKACELSEWKHPMCLGTLAAAHAELGQWADAVKWQEKAIARADKNTLDEFRKCLELYKASKPKRD